VFSELIRSRVDFWGVAGGVGRIVGEFEKKTDNLDLMFFLSGLIKKYAFSHHSSC